MKGICVVVYVSISKGGMGMWVELMGYGRGVKGE